MCNSWIKPQLVAAHKRQRDQCGSGCATGIGMDLSTGQLLCNSTIRKRTDINVHLNNYRLLDDKLVFEFGNDIYQSK